VTGIPLRIFGKPPLRIVSAHPGVALNLKRRIPAPTTPELNLTRIWDHRKVEGQGGGCAPSNWLAQCRIRVALNHFGIALNCSAAARCQRGLKCQTSKPLPKHEPVTAPTCCLGTRRNRLLVVRSSPAPTTRYRLRHAHYTI
jgi:hypothetical protein